MGEQEKRRGLLGRGWTLTGAVCLLFSLVIAAIGGFQVVDEYWLRQRGEVVTGTVLDEWGSRDSSIEVRYVTRTGETYVETTSNYVDAEVGKSIQIIYDPGKPQRMHGADWAPDPWSTAALYGLTSLAFLAFGVAKLRDSQS
ncbi:DUF3592 domain-containing protein [Kribbella sandramycini]|uniref:DUF3592 domain-containing protein n=1 Tax=Kribbella sandramycini TaxID=60450 RepID=A0A7Y4L5C8_9ACTN|nr:DUF3592 domain-containing protein [Kribbella sandramycini]MBB6566956.1 hypothetical protein [Kribbella sandramycini]NOL44678.1 DUF3592 domain-containing protein [Kribbella sandramycini]